jgi:hypothetical protein
VTTYFELKFSKPLRTWRFRLPHKTEQGRIQDFKFGEGAHLKKLRRAEGDAKFFGVFRVKNHDFTPKYHIFSNFHKLYCSYSSHLRLVDFFILCINFIYIYMLFSRQNRFVAIVYIYNYQNI